MGWTDRIFQALEKHGTLSFEALFRECLAQDREELKQTVNHLIDIGECGLTLDWEVCRRGVASVPEEQRLRAALLGLIRDREVYVDLRSGRLSSRPIPSGEQHEEDTPT